MWISTFPVCWTFLKIDYSVFIEWFLSSCPCTFRNLGVLVCCGIYVSVSMSAPLHFDYCALVQVFICGYVQLHSQRTSTVIVPVFIFVVSINVAVSRAECPLVCGFWRRLVVGWWSALGGEDFAVLWTRFSVVFYLWWVFDYCISLVVTGLLWVCISWSLFLSIPCIPRHFSTSSVYHSQGAPCRLLQ
jgi:hypothetical protein